MSQRSCSPNSPTADDITSQPLLATPPPSHPIDQSQVQPSPSHDVPPPGDDPVADCIRDENEGEDIGGSDPPVAVSATTKNFTEKERLWIFSAYSQLHTVCLRQVCGTWGRVAALGIEIARLEYH